MARTCASELSESSPLIVVHRTPPSPPVYKSPEAYLSPGIRSENEVQEHDVLKHSLSGMFPSVSLFKEYQSSAMAVFFFHF